MKRWSIFACAMFAFSQSAAAQDDAERWHQLTRGDVEAAYQQLIEDHPALSTAINDAELRARLETGRALALERAAQVSSIEGYAATMAGLANVVGDKHVWSRLVAPAHSVQWAGIITARQGERFVVLEHDNAGEGASLAGAALVSCDGVMADDFAAAKLGGFRAVWSIEAQRIQSAPFLLVDDGNPFVLRPQTCIFERDGQRTEHTLFWREIARTDLAPHIRRAQNRGAPGHGLRTFDGGMWISLQTLNDDALAVVAAARESQSRLRASPIVVVDMRGNGGGSSSYGDQIARVLFGDARFNHVIRGGARCNVVWRVSPRNVAQMRSYEERFRQSNPSFAGEMRRAVQRAEQAQAAGREFTGPTECPSRRAASGAPPAQTATGRIVLLTDNACFSSCLLVADNFRRLGALHVGQATDAATHYFEVREDPLPSGLSFFSTLQAFSPGSLARLGPFAPGAAYDGDMADTAALEGWIEEVVAAR
ncbi:S41 family peptidase [Candidatus Viadribacter manganicus]|uniref:Tail specific protease domain-containing protein n=1 Tax=Candidatus Viadribacter manganicus TaxID=1759059 RepID=A0A1B1AH11_9PROT|nr:S41 family peptidase [Candidatus Viadribacter manganicus]ANP45856.1 hypothetical protein ATE48_07920 [Candidatus Viadribacter manganicus]